MARSGAGSGRLRSAAGVTTLLSFCLVANLAPLMSFPAVLPKVAEAWHLSAAEAGWIGGIYFAGYALAVPFLSSASDRLDGRWVVAASSLLGAVAGFGFAGLADGFWTALLLRFAGGIALAGVHMPALTLLTERIEVSSQARGVSIYTSSYALGSSGSFLLAGLVDAMLGWRAAFFASALGPLLAVAAVACLSPLPSPRAPSTRSGFVEDFRHVLSDRSFLAYVVGFAGNTWEVFGIRVWFVACLAWTLSIPGNGLDLPNLAVIAGLSSLAGVPASVLVAEIGSRTGRPRAIAVACGVSVLVCLALAATAGGPVALVLSLLILLQITSFADVGALGAGAVALTDPTRRGTALAVYALAGFTTGFLGPAAIGVTLDLCGGAASASGWTAAFLVMAVGSTTAGLAVWCARRGIRDHPAG